MVVAAVTVVALAWAEVYEPSSALRSARLLVRGDSTHGWQRDLDASDPALIEMAGQIAQALRHEYSPATCIWFTNMPLWESCSGPDCNALFELTFAHPKSSGARNPRIARVRFLYSDPTRRDIEMIDAQGHSFIAALQWGVDYRTPPTSAFLAAANDAVQRFPPSADPAYDPNYRSFPIWHFSSSRERQNASMPL